MPLRVSSVDSLCLAHTTEILMQVSVKTLLKVGSGGLVPLLGHAAVNMSCVSSSVKDLSSYYPPHSAVATNL